MLEFIAVYLFIGALFTASYRLTKSSADATWWAIGVMLWPVLVMGLLIAWSAHFLGDK